MQRYILVLSSLASFCGMYCHPPTHTDPVNCASLDDIETAILSISLDKAHPSMANLDPKLKFNDYQCSLHAKNVLHGNGSQLNSINRWSDMCIQVHYVQYVYVCTHAACSHSQWSSQHSVNCGKTLDYRATFSKPRQYWLSD